MLKLTVQDLMDTSELMEEINAGYVTEKFHPVHELAIYTYTNSCVYDARWNTVTKTCRGLILNDLGEVVALPFPKTFVVDIHLGGAPYAKPLPDGPFRMTNKVDGSLAIVFFYEGKWRVATKGSFHSDHTEWGQQYLDARNTGGLDRSLTYLAEMIIPDWGRIVVDYGSTADMVLLGARSLYTGAYQRLETLEEGWRPIGSVVETFGSSSTRFIEAFNKLIKKDPKSGTEFEGVVFQWADGSLAKCKSLSYLEYHKTVTRTSERTIWTLLASGGSPASLFTNSPDEFTDWVKGIVAKLEQRHHELVNEVVEAYREITDTLPVEHTRKDFALLARNYKYANVLFQMYDGNGKGVSDWAWKQLEPYGRTPTAFNSKLS